MDTCVQILIVIVTEIITATIILIIIAIIDVNISIYYHRDEKWTISLEIKNPHQPMHLVF